MERVVDKPVRTRVEECSASPLGMWGTIPVRAVVHEAQQGKAIVVMHGPTGAIWSCEVLEPISKSFRPGDRVLVLPPQGEEPAIVLGRLGRYEMPPSAPALVIDSPETLTLKCGEACIQLRADGKVLIRGEDVLVRAKKTKRIRAGTVSIN